MTHPDVPIAVFAKGASFGLEHIGSTSFDVVGLDWKTSVSEARAKLPGKCLQGNLDPHTIYAGPLAISKGVKGMVSEFAGVAHIAGLGDGCEPKMEPDAILCFVDEVKQAKGSVFVAQSLLPTVQD